jgi:RNA polymerase-binding transcription factor DksA
MNKSDLKLYKQRLLSLRGRLRGDVDDMARSVLDRTLVEARGNMSATPIHMADIGSDNYDQQFNLDLMESKDRTLREIEVALERIEDGVYGVCVTCEGRIPKARLNAIPYAVHCVQCASRLEPA